MHRFNVLGHLELTDERGRPVRSVLAQPRRLALMVYLALEGRSRPVDRERLIQLFWSEVPDARARASLRQALHFLRQALGADAIRSDENHAVCLDPEGMTVDVWEFETALDEGRFDEALAYYRDTLATDLFFEGEVDFEQWLDGAREHLRAQAATAARRGRDVAAADGPPGMALLLARRAVELSPYAREDAERLATLLEASGQAEEAARALEALANRLADELEEEPPADMQHRIRALRGAAHTPPPAPSEDRADPVSAHAGGPPPPSRAGRVDLRRAAMVGAAAALVASTLWFVQGLRPPPPPPPHDVVAVLPFSYRGNGDLAFLGEGVVSVLESGLGGAGDVRPLTIRAMPPHADGNRDPRVVARRAAAVGVGTWITGEIVETGTRVHISTLVHTFAGDVPTVAIQLSREGPSADAMALIEEIGRTVLEALSGTGFVRRALGTTRSAAAARAFTAGERRYRSGRYREAVDHFNAATRADSSFALGYYRLGLAAANGGIPGGEGAARRALDLAPGLSTMDSALVAAWNLQLRGSILEADIWFRSLVARRPDDAEAWFRLAELRYHWQGVVAAAPMGPRQALLRVLALEPDHPGALFHLARWEARSGGTAAFESLADRLRASDADPLWSDELDLIRAWINADRSEADRLADALARGAPSQVGSVFASGVASSARLAPARRFLDTWRGTSGEHPWITLWTAQLSMAAGRTAEADQALERGILPPLRRLEMRAVLAATPGVEVPSERRRALMETLRATPGRPMPLRTDPVWRGSLEVPPLAWDGLEEQHRLFLLALLAHDLDEDMLVSECLDGFDVTDEAGALFRRVVAARVALTQGNAAGAMEMLGPPRDPVPAVFETFTDYGRVYERYLRAEILEALGRDDEALAWYATFPDPTARDLPFLAPSHRARARLHESAGRPEDARWSLLEVARLWKDGEEPMRSVAADAGRRAERLGGG